jgi:hypothetical protein
MPPAKSLLEHCLHGTFRSRRHHPLLAGPRLPWPSLASLQVRYVSATSEPERRAIGLVVEQASRAADKDEPDPFERAVVDLLEAAGLIEDGLIDMAATLASALDVDVSRETLGDGQKRTATRGLTPAEFWYAGMGPGFGDWTGRQRSASSARPRKSTGTASCGSSAAGDGGTGGTAATGEPPAASPTTWTS